MGIGFASLGDGCLYAFRRICCLLIDSAEVFDIASLGSGFYPMAASVIFFVVKIRRQSKKTFGWQALTSPSPLLERERPGLPGQGEGISLTPVLQPGGLTPCV